MAEPAVHGVTLEWDDGRTVTLEVAAGQRVLAAAEAAGVSLPFGCRRGACGTCTGRLLDGELRHRRPPRALKQRHRDAGYVLLCVATPTTDCRVRVGAAVQDELVSNPWE